MANKTFQCLMYNCSTFINLLGEDSPSSNRNIYVCFHSQPLFCVRAPTELNFRRQIIAWRVGNQSKGKQIVDRGILPPEKPVCMKVKKQQSELDMEQRTGSKLGKVVCQGCILSPCLFTCRIHHVKCQAA